MDLYSLIICMQISTNRVLHRNVTVFKVIVTNFYWAHYEVGKNKWQNVNRRPYHEHIFMKQKFSFPVRLCM